MQTCGNGKALRKAQGVGRITWNEFIAPWGQQLTDLGMFCSAFSSHRFIFPKTQHSEARLGFFFLLSLQKLNKGGNGDRRTPSWKHGDSWPLDEQNAVRNSSMDQRGALAGGWRQIFPPAFSDDFVICIFPFLLFALRLEKKKYVISRVLWTLKCMPCMWLSSNILKYSKCEDVGAVPGILSFWIKVSDNQHFPLPFLPEEVISDPAPLQSREGTWAPWDSQKVIKLHSC